MGELPKESAAQRLFKMLICLRTRSKMRRTTRTTRRMTRRLTRTRTTTRKTRKMRMRRTRTRRMKTRMTRTRGTRMTLRRPMNLAKTKVLFRPTYDPVFFVLIIACYHWDSAYYDTPSILFCEGHM